MRTAAVVDLLGDECLDLQLDASSTAGDREVIDLCSHVALPTLGEIYEDWLSGW